jgi:hypothetical protein
MRFASLSLSPAILSLAIILHDPCVIGVTAALHLPEVQAFPSPFRNIALGPVTIPCEFW